MNEPRYLSFVHHRIIVLVGTNLRKLVHDGYPASGVIGCDLRPEHFDLVYELFGDSDYLSSHILASPYVSNASRSSNLSRHQLKHCVYCQRREGQNLKASEADHGGSIAIAFTTIILTKRREADD